MRVCSARRKNPAGIFAGKIDFFPEGCEFFEQSDGKFVEIAKKDAITTVIAW